MGTSAGTMSQAEPARSARAGRLRRGWSARPRNWRRPTQRRPATNHIHAAATRAAPAVPGTANPAPVRSAKPAHTNRVGRVTRVWLSLRPASSHPDPSHPRRLPAYAPSSPASSCAWSSPIAPRRAVTSAKRSVSGAMAAAKAPR